MNDLIKAAANALADAADSDILIYSGDIERPFDDQLLDELLRCNGLRKNVILILCTGGGNPDAAYRIARGLQEHYSRFTVLAGGPLQECRNAFGCRSA